MMFGAQLPRMRTQQHQHQQLQLRPILAVALLLLLYLNQRWVLDILLARDENTPQIENRSQTGLIS